MKLYFSIIFALVVFIFSACETPNPDNEGKTGGTPPSLNGKEYPTLGEIERLDPALDRHPGEPIRAASAAQLEDDGFRLIALGMGQDQGVCA